MVLVDMPADTAQELVDAEAYKYCTCDEFGVFKVVRRDTTARKYQSE